MMLYGMGDSRFRYSDETTEADLAGVALLGILPNLPDRLSDPQQAGHRRPLRPPDPHHAADQPRQRRAAGAGHHQRQHRRRQDQPDPGPGPELRRLRGPHAAGRLRPGRRRFNPPPERQQSRRRSRGPSRTGLCWNTSARPTSPMLPSCRSAPTHAHHASTLSPGGPASVAQRGEEDSSTSSSSIPARSSAQHRGEPRCAPPPTAPILAVARNQQKAAGRAKSINHLQRRSARCWPASSTTKPRRSDFERSMNGLALRSRPAVRQPRRRRQRPGQRTVGRPGRRRVVQKGRADFFGAALPAAPSLN